MKRPLTELKNKHFGADVYVLGSAASMDWIDPAFFAGRVTIGCNWVFQKFPCTYSAWMEVMPGALHLHPRVIVPQHPNANDSHKGWGVEGYGTDAETPDHWVFPHRMKQSVIGPDSDEIWIGDSTISMALHLAAYLGGKNIFLAGVDGGWLDGKIQYADYPRSSEDPRGYHEWLRNILPQTPKLRDALCAAYGCRVFLLSPFVNFQLEGHRFHV